MKNFIKKNKRGFSLVEILVVVAMMGIITAIMAPSFVNYIESTKADKDTHRMEELVEVIEIALADDKTYNDVIKYAAYGNASCYVDPTAKDEYSTSRMDMRGLEITYDETRNRKAHFTFSDEWRKEDKTERMFAGNMYGVTITFQPANKVITFGDGRFNMAFNGGNRWTTGEEDGVDGNGKNVNYGQFGTLSTMDSMENSLLRAVLSDMSQSIVLESRTYETSSYTVFIRLSPPLEGDTIIDSVNNSGPIGQPQQTVLVYGQWNGTYLKKTK